MTNSSRTAAIAAGQLTYKTDKPCKFGHDGDRYTSTGGCIQCLKDRQNNFQQARRQNRIAKNTALFDGLQPFQFFVRASQKDDLSAYADVLRYGSADVQEQCRTFIALMRQQAFGK